MEVRHEIWGLPKVFYRIIHFRQAFKNRNRPKELMSHLELFSADMLRLVTQLCLTL